MLRFLNRFLLYLQDRSLDFHALCALYAVTGIHFVLQLSNSLTLLSQMMINCLDVNDSGKLVTIMTQNGMAEAWKIVEGNKIFHLFLACESE